MTRSTLRAAVAALILAAGLGTACKKADNAPPAADSSAMMNPAPTLQVATVDVGTAIDAERRVTTSGTTFGIRDTIYAAVATTGNGNGTLTARWTFEDGQVVEESQQAVAASGNATTEFHIAKPSAWPAGKYRVTILLDGREVSSKDFEIK
jgi:hypothetical protein